MGNAVDAKDERNDSETRGNRHTRRLLGWVFWPVAAFVLAVTAVNTVAPALAAPVEPLAGTLMVFVVLPVPQLWMILYVSDIVRRA